jgi:hypothetical protein
LVSLQKTRSFTGQIVDPASRYTLASSAER